MAKITVHQLPLPLGTHIYNLNQSCIGIAFQYVFILKCQCVCYFQIDRSSGSEASFPTTRFYVVTRHGEEKMPW